MKDRSVYRIYEGDRFITEGTESEIKEYLHTTINQPLSQHSAHGYKLLRKYKVECIYHAERAYTYDFYEDGKLVFTGTQRELEERYNFRLKGSVASYEKGKSLIHDRWIAKRHGGERVKVDKTFERILEHIKLYGNTISEKEPTEYIEKLKEKGYVCSYRKVMEKTGVGRPKRPFYVIET